jgi:hypothetical protein
MRVSFLETAGQLQARNSGKLDVENEADMPLPGGAAEEFLGRAKHVRLKLGRPQKSRERFSDSLVIVDDCDASSADRHFDTSSALRNYFTVRIDMYIVLW